MSAVTLETLRADFEAARWAFWKAYEAPRMFSTFGRAINLTSAFLFIWFAGPARLSAFFAEYAGEPEFVEEYALYRAATYYSVFRKGGMSALLFWKLSDGLMDPRKAGEE